MNDDAKSNLILSTIEEYIIYAESVIQEYKEIKNLAYNRNITPEQINTALAMYMKVSEVLIDEYEKSKITLNIEKNDFEIWWDEKYNIIRNRENPRDSAKNKWLSQKEIESIVRVENKEEYLIKKSHLDMLECKVSKLRRLNESYKNFSFLIRTMADNSRTQMSNLTLENSMNKNIRNVKRG